MTDKLIVTDGTSSGLSAGAAISDTDYLELQQTTVSPASTVNSQFSAIKTWIKAWIVKADVGLGNVDNTSDANKPVSTAQATADALALLKSDNLASVANATTARGNLGAWANLWKPYSVSGNFHWPFGYNAGSSGAIPTSNQTYLYPVIFPADVTISDLFIRISAGAAGNWQAAIYNSHATTYKPTTLVAKSVASTATTGSAIVTASGGLNTNPTLTAGTLYYFAFSSDATVPTYTTASVNGNLFSVGALVGSATLANVFVNGPTIGYAVASQALGTWADLSAATFLETTTSNFPLIGFKVA